MSSIYQLVKEFFTRRLSGYFNWWYFILIEKSLKDFNGSVLYKVSNPGVPNYRANFIYSDLENFSTFSCFNINQIGSSRGYEAAHPRFSPPCVIDLNLQVMVIKLHWYGIHHRHQAA